MSHLPSHLQATTHILACSWGVHEIFREECVTENLILESRTEEKYIGGKDFGINQHRWYHFHGHRWWDHPGTACAQGKTNDEVLKNTNKRAHRGTGKGNYFCYVEQSDMSIFGSSVNFSKCILIFEPHNTSVRGTKTIPHILQTWLSEISLRLLTTSSGSFPCNYDAAEKQKRTHWEGKDATSWVS